MLDHIGRAELDTLVASEGGPHVSIYMPTHAAAIDTEQDVLRLKTLTQRAEKDLVEGWMRSVEIGDFLAPISALIHNDEFWRKRQSGLSIFRSENDFRVYRLGISFDERLSISRNYLVRPIVPAIHQALRGYMLALSEHKVALYELREHSIEPVEVPLLPVNIEDTLNYTSVDRGQQTHTASATHDGKHSVVFHGQGGKSESHKDDLRHFFRSVDEVITAYLGESNDPLILACVDTSAPIYREVNSYVGLREEHVTGNVEYLTKDELHRRGVVIIKAEQQDLRDGLANRIREHLNTSVASDKASEVIRAAFQGKIHTLFFQDDAIIEGQFDPVLQSAVVFEDSSNLQFTPYNTDLIESTVQQTLRHRGDIYAVSQAEMPGKGPLAALFRY